MRVGDVIPFPTPVATAGGSLVVGVIVTGLGAIPECIPLMTDTTTTAHVIQGERP